MVVGRRLGEVEPQEGRVQGEAHRSPISGRLARKGVGVKAQEEPSYETAAADARFHRQGGENRRQQR
ncbi:hypothetical protein DL766_003496 [Monosporascus sp. MC13-8B]|uniref:Uncharacterized protein n=1 Tax=Monosporascus cannonballus TaxID=155416 RepID=A0ABY0HKA7_9PEZI|nr:hypothetical protein DL763_009721 [Monosporascus cannonballus]RYO95473.1 hypothetical protein DL762_000035 [Monosporascus cannonballus]RYP33334.1 hypothetical protein DL766_003496 [Monosporascus sp. MC13-8B]